MPGNHGRKGRKKLNSEEKKNVWKKGNGCKIVETKGAQQYEQFLPCQLLFNSFLCYFIAVLTIFYDYDSINVERERERESKMKYK